MSYLDAIILGIVQGVTEFLPISSSGHLVLGEHFLGLNVADLKSFDVAVHMATLLAIIIYFWKDFKGLVVGFLYVITGQVKKAGPYANLILYIVVGTVPAVIVGLFFEDVLDEYFRNIRSVAFFMLGAGVIFIIGEKVYRIVYRGKSTGEKLKLKGDLIKELIRPGSSEKGEVRGMKWYKAVIIGVFQAAALIPGVSRSGSTIVAGLFQGVDRSSAARFSFLLGIPAILGAGILTGMKIPESGGLGVDIGVLMVGFVFAFLAGLVSVSFLMRFLKSNSLFVFAFYLIVVGLYVIS